MKEEYVPPYNYCNYRCEKCPDLKNCTLASMEMIREAELVAQGKDPPRSKSYLRRSQRLLRGGHETPP